MRTWSLCPVASFGLPTLLLSRLGLYDGPAGEQHLPCNSHPHFGEMHLRLTIIRRMPLHVHVTVMLCLEVEKALCGQADGHQHAVLKDNMMYCIAERDCLCCYWTQEPELAGCAAGTRICASS